MGKAILLNNWAFFARNFVCAAAIPYMNHRRNKTDGTGATADTQQYITLREKKKLTKEKRNKGIYLMCVCIHAQLVQYTF